MRVVRALLLAATSVAWLAVLACGTEEVTIDVKGTSGGGCINRLAPSHDSWVSVFVLTTDEFDAADVDKQGLSLEGETTGVKAVNPGYIGRWFKDVDSDGDQDLVAQFKIPTMQLTVAETGVILNGRTTAGKPLRGTEAVCVVSVTPVPEQTIEDYLEAEKSFGTTDLRVAIETSPGPVVIARELAYTVTVTNAGPRQVFGFRVTDELPPGVTYVSDSIGCIQDRADFLICDVSGLMEVGDSRQIRITVLVAEPALDLLINTVTVENPVDEDLISMGYPDTVYPDPAPSNNRVVVETQVAAP